jgi:hypothetical protein
MKPCERVVAVQRSRPEVLVLTIFLRTTGFVLGMMAGGLAAGYWFAQQESDSGYTG